MSNSIFPAADLPGLAVEVEREEQFFTRIHSGGWWAPHHEERTKGLSVPRFRYTLRFNGLRDDVQAPSPNQAHTETGIVLKFLRDHYGSFESFVFRDPLDGFLRRVRLETDSVILTKDVEWWVLQSLSLVTPAQPLTVSVSPTTASPARSATQQFTATVYDAISDNTVTWSVQSGLGSIDQNGLYTAPNAATTAVVRATSDEDAGIYAEATVTVL